MLTYRQNGVALGQELLSSQRITIFGHNGHDGVALSQADLVHNLGVLLDLKLLFEEQVAVVARRTFAQLGIVCHSWINESFSQSPIS